MFLYKNKTGIIAVGVYTGKCTDPELNKEKEAPDWDKDEKLCHIVIEKWEKQTPPIKYRPLPQTLYKR